MIKSLSLTNFRRHAALDLRFDEGSQLVLISGANGVGKTSVLEAITFALWGEGRHGRKHLDRLTRRGAELEGMSVEMVFSVADADYRVLRRRDGKSSTALLFVNDVALAEGPVQVTEEITKILGMDSAGFRLAVIAQQKDLDGLASLRPAERAQMMTRLLRLDVLTAAKTEASSLLRRERDIAAALRGADVESAEAEAKAAEDELQAAEAEQRQARESLAVVDAELAASADVEALWLECSEKLARLSGARDSLSAQLDSAQALYESLVVPDPVEEIADIGEIAAEASSVERAIATAEQAARDAAQRAAVSRDLGEVTERIAALEADLLGSDPDTAAFEVEVAEANRRLERTRSAREAARIALAGAERDLLSLSERIAATESLEATCATCGQAISEEHRASQAKLLAEEYQRAEAARDHAQSTLDEAQAETRLREEELEKATQEMARAVQVRHERELLRSEVSDLSRRRDVYQGQLERLGADTVDLDPLYARRGELAVMLATAQEAAERAQARATGLARQEAARQEIVNLTATLEESKRAIDAAAPSADLQQRHAQRQELQRVRAAEADLLSYWTTQVAVQSERVNSCRARVADARAQADRQRQHHEVAVSAAGAVRLLADVSERLSTQIRPSLEATVSTVLSAMSEGRFSAVKLSDDYDMYVEDDGEFRALSELSGGEVDLVALATRLALSQVVAERHGAGGAGFLILDECFGSQDPQRRSAILSALRNLRDLYTQIFLISHVEGIEDAADVVIEVSASEDRSETEVTVT